MSILRLLGAAGVLLLVLASPAAAHKRDNHHHNKDVKVQLLALNDFHGALQTTTTGGIRPPTPAGQPAPAPIAALDETTLEGVTEIAHGISVEASVACVGPHEVAEFA